MSAPPISFPSKANSLGLMDLVEDPKNIDLWNVGVDEGNVEIPFPTTARAFFKAKGRGKRLIEVALSRDEENRFSFVHEDGSITASETPTGFLTQFALKTGNITIPTARQNWGTLWFTVDDGATFVRGRTLRDFHSVVWDLKKRESVRSDHD